MAFSALLPYLPAIASAVGPMIGRAFSGKKDSQRSSLFTKPEEIKEINRFTPQQQQTLGDIQNILSGRGEAPKGGILGQLFSPEGFEAYAKPAQQFFEQRIAPNIAEQFSSLGAGSQGSSAFQQQLAQAGRELSENLGSMRAQQQQNLLAPLLSQFLQPQLHQQLIPESPTGFGKGASYLGGELLKEGLPLLFDLIRAKFGGAKR